MRIELMRMNHLIAGGALFLFPFVAKAQAGTEGFQNSLNLAAGASGLQTVQSPGAFVGNLISAVLALSGLILVCVLVYAGILYMQGGADEGKVKQAKKLILNSIIGIVLIIVAYAASVFIIDAITQTVGA